MISTDRILTGPFVAMLKRNYDKVILITILLFGLCCYHINPTIGLNINSWHLLVIFICTILGAILNPIPIGLVVMISILVSILTNTISIERAFSGFSTSIVWLVVFAFFISRSVIKSNLGKRLAYFFISKIGGSLLGLSYGLVFTDLILAPFIPSASARGGGIIYPIAQSITQQYNFLTSNKDNNSNISKYLMQLCFQTNIVTSSMFLTAMAGNPLIASLAKSINIHLSIYHWWIACIIPSLCILSVLPFILMFLTKMKHQNISHGPVLAETALKEMGPLSRNERIVLFTFGLLIVLWMGAEPLNIDPATTALLGFIILTLSNVLSWQDAINEKEAWQTFIWFAGFVMLSQQLSMDGITTWLGSNIKVLIMGYDPIFAIPCTLILFFYMHYFFASITVYASVMYVTFTMLLIALGVPAIVAGFAIAIAANLSACLTQYGTTTAPIFFTASHMSLKQWWQVGFVMSVFYLFIWSIIGSMWWKVLGWW